MTSSTTSSTAAAYLRPQPGEYAPYTGAYISLVEGNDVLAALDEQRRQMLLLFSGRTDADGDLRYAPDKWTLKEVLGHINDSERILSYRALRISRAEAVRSKSGQPFVRFTPFWRAVRAKGEPRALCQRPEYGLLQHR